MQSNLHGVEAGEGGLDGLTGGRSITHSGEAQQITLQEETTSVSSGLSNTVHTLPNIDGIIFLKVKTGYPADVNGDIDFGLFCFFT